MYICIPYIICKYISSKYTCIWYICIHKWIYLLYVTRFIRLSTSFHIATHSASSDKERDKKPWASFSSQDMILANSGRVISSICLSSCRFCMAVLSWSTFSFASSMSRWPCSLYPLSNTFILITTTAITTITILIQ